MTRDSCREETWLNIRTAAKHGGAIPFICENHVRDADHMSDDQVE